MAEAGGRLGEKKTVDLREVWPKELDFSGWLAKHIEILNEQLRWDLDAASVQQEVSAGSLRVDLLAEARESGSDKRFPVVIENQLETTDDSHLAGVMAYTAAFKAKGAIWIAGNVSPVYVDVMNWLNANAEIDAYLFKVETIRIDESRPVPILTRVVGPAPNWPVDREREKRNQQVRNWWGRLQKPLSDVHPAWNSLKPHVSRNPSVHIPGAPEPLCWYVGVAEHSSDVGILISGETKERTDYYYDELAKRRGEIDTRFGDQLDWSDPPRGPRRMRWVFWRNPEPGGFADDPDVQEKAAAGIAGAMKCLVAATEGVAGEIAEPCQRSVDERGIVVRVGAAPSWWMPISTFASHSNRCTSRTRQRAQPGDAIPAGPHGAWHLSADLTRGGPHAGLYAMLTMRRPKAVHASDNASDLSADVHPNLSDAQNLGRRGILTSSSLRAHRGTGGLDSRC